MNHLISSDNRALGESHNFQHLFREPTDHNRISLIYCSIPKTYYNIDSDSNSFELDNNAVNLPAQNYSVRQFVNQLNIITGLTVVYNGQTGKLSISSTINSTIKIIGRSLADSFGLAAETVYTLPITSVRPINLQANRNIHISIDIISDYSYGNSLNNLAVIDASNTQSFGVINYQNPDYKATAKHIDPTDRVSDIIISVALKNDVFEYIHMNSHNWFMVVRTWRESVPISIIPKLQELIDVLKTRSKKK